MKVFQCNKCQQPIYFQNSICVSCHSTLAFLPDIMDMTALEPLEDGRWRSLSDQTSGRSYTLCKNYSEQAICNWAIAPEESLPFCRSCSLTQVIPDLTVPANLDGWRNLELAKRRLLYSLYVLGFPVVGREQDEDVGLAFEFLNDTGSKPEERALTGHANGLITINAAEADDVERERRRKTMHEPYRTLLGHFRHEVGHYYWDLLMLDQARLSEFRRIFGNERLDYAKALKAHYKKGATKNWQSFFVSAYASSHPWEDWAETWAHYLHMTDALDTASAGGMVLHSCEHEGPSPSCNDAMQGDAFDQMIADWLALARVLNNLSRSLGLSDAYPFVLAPAVIQKLRFVHSCVPYSFESRARILQLPPA